METKKVYEAISNITSDLAKVGIAKEQTNQQQRFKFRGIDQVYAALSPLLAKHKLVILPRVIERTVTERESKSGGTLFYTVLTVEYDLVSSVDGSSHIVRIVGEAMDSGDKSVPKALSMAYKAMAFEVFAIPVEADDDADANSHDVAPNPPAKSAIIRPPQQRQEAPAPAKDDRKLTHEERKHLVSVISGLKLPMLEAQTLLGNLGYKSTADIPLSKLQFLLDALTRAAKQQSQNDGDEAWDNFGKEGDGEPGDSVQ